MSTPSWAVIVTRVAQEERAEEHFRKAGFRVYLPRERKLLSGVRIVDGKRVRCHGHFEPVLRPLLSCFLFAELHPGQRIEADRLSGRWQHWRHNRKRAFVSEHAIETLRAVERKHGVFDDQPMSPFEEGETVAWEIVPGKPIEAVFDELDGYDRGIIQAMMFGRPIRQSVPLAKLRKLSA